MKQTVFCHRCKKELGTVDVDWLVSGMCKNCYEETAIAKREILEKP